MIMENAFLDKRYIFMALQLLVHNYTRIPLCGF